jgi:hypothetical protein
MSTRDAYKQKMEAELDLAQAKVGELRARAKGLAADARIGLGRQVDGLEKDIDAAKGRLRDLGAAGEDAWEGLKGGIDGAWDKLSTAVRDAVAKAEQ